MLSWRMMRWYSTSVAANAMLKRMSQKDEATIVFVSCFTYASLLAAASWELVGLLGSAVDFFEEYHHRGAHSSTG